MLSFSTLGEIYVLKIKMQTALIVHEKLPVEERGKKFSINIRGNEDEDNSEYLLENRILCHLIFEFNIKNVNNANRKHLLKRTINNGTGKC